MGPLLFARPCPAGLRRGQEPVRPFILNLDAEGCPLHISGWDMR